jgi:putative transposase
MALLVRIWAVFTEMKGAYGWPSIWRELVARGIHAGKARANEKKMLGEEEGKAA